MELRKDKVASRTASHTHDQSKKNAEDQPSSKKNSCEEVGPYFILVRRKHFKGEAPFPEAEREKKRLGSKLWGKAYRKMFSEAREKNLVLRKFPLGRRIYLQG